MKQRLIISNEQKEALACELSDTKQLVQKLRDELSTNVRNYETQLETMSEHLATMNEKWSNQQIEIDSLRQSVSQRVSLCHFFSDLLTYFSLSTSRDHQNHISSS